MHIREGQIIYKNGFRLVNWCAPALPRNIKLFYQKYQISKYLISNIKNVLAKNQNKRKQKEERKKKKKAKATPLKKKRQVTKAGFKS